jgi:hypothetical protein
MHSTEEAESRPKKLTYNCTPRRYFILEGLDTNSLRTVELLKHSYWSGYFKIF